LSSCVLTSEQLKVGQPAVGLILTSAGQLKLA
jgi:hypothetical protein